MKLNNIFPNYETFKSDVIDKLNLLFPNVEWLNENNSYMSFKTIYGLLTLYYGDRDIRYDNEQTFINKFTFDLADLLPDIYAKQQVFINNELKTYLSSAKNRAIKIQGKTTSNREQNNNSKAANSTTPANIVITNANELDRLPITSANLSDVTLIDNINSSNEQTNFKYIDDLVKNLTSDYSLRIKDFMNLIKNHFTFIDTSNVKKECDGLYDSNRFRNGYYVSKVDYLGAENQDQIKLTNGKVSKNTIDIQKIKRKVENIPNFNDYYNKNETNKLLQEKQDKLICGNNITIKNNIISANCPASGGNDYTTTDNNIIINNKDHTIKLNSNVEAIKYNFESGVLGNGLLHLWKKDGWSCQYNGYGIVSFINSDPPNFFNFSGEWWNDDCVVRMKDIKELKKQFREATLTVENGRLKSSESLINKEYYFTGKYLIREGPGRTSYCQPFPTINVCTTNELFIPFWNINGKYISVLFWSENMSTDSTFILNCSDLQLFVKDI